MLHQEWNTGYIVTIWIGVITAGIGLLIFLGCGIYWLWGSDRNGQDFTISGYASLAGALLAIIGGIVIVVGGFPFAGQYHRYEPVSGTVSQTISSRFLSDGSGGTTQNFLVYINGQPYRCDDTRCAGLHKGEAVTLMCEKSYQPNSVAGYVCNWGRLGLNS